MLETCRAHIAIADNLNAMSLRSKTVNAQSHPQQQQQKPLDPQNQHACRNSTKSHASDRVSGPAKNSTCQSCGRIGQWDVRCQSTSSRENDPNKRPPRCGPKGGKQMQTHTVGVWDYHKPQCDEVYVITIDVHPYHSAQLGQKSRDDHARSVTLLP